MSKRTSDKRREQLKKMAIIRRTNCEERRLLRELKLEETSELNNLDQQINDGDIKVEPEPPPSESVEEVADEEEVPGIKVEASSSLPVIQNEGDGIIKDNSGDDPGNASTAASSSATTNANKQSWTPPHNIQSLSICFVCVKPLTSEEMRRKVTEAEYICLLSDMLELSVSQSHQHLQRIREPGKWIGLCHPCLGLIKEVGRRKLVIAKMEREIKSRQQQIVKKMKGTKLNLRVRGKNGEEGDNASKEGKALKTVRTILNFVHQRQYSTLFADKHVPNSIKDSTERASFSKKISSIGHRVVTQQLRLQPPVQKKKTVRPVKIGKLAKALQIGTSVNVNQRQREKMRIDKSDQCRGTQEEEVPIFLNADDDHRMEDEALAVTDPLALDDDADCIVNKPCSVSQSQVYFCGLCSDNDDQVYRSEEQLQLHTNQVHRPSTPTPLTKHFSRQNKRQRKQTFPAASKEEKKFEEIPIQKKPRRSMEETAPTIPFTTSSERHSKAEEEEVKPIGSVDVDAYHRSEGDPEEENEEETGENQPKQESTKKPAKPAVRFQYECPYCPSNVKNYSICRFPEHLALALSNKDDIAGKKPSNSKGTVLMFQTTVEQRQGDPEEEPTWAKYDCPNCPDVKNYGVNRFAQHLAIHQKRPFRCTICSALFSSDLEQMEEHWKQKHPDVEIGAGSPPEKFKKMTLDPGEIWKCQGQGCSSGFRMEDDRNAHELECPSSIRRKLTRMASRRVLSPSRSLPHYSCQTCTKPFRNVEEWRLHRVLHHPDVDRLCCLVCELSFAEKTGDGVEARHDFKMLSHIKQDHNNGQARNHRILEECEECGLVFNSLLERQDHFLEVHGISKAERIVSCTVSCGLWFTNLPFMRGHVNRVHFSGDGSVCDVCGTGFKYLKTVVEHKLREHGVLEDDYNSPVYTCPVEGCGYRTVKQQALLVHSQMAHGEARKYICKICGKGFTESGKLKAHEKIHENKETKPYQCELCGNSFAVRNYLYIHKRLSHENRKFPSTNRKRAQKKDFQSQIQK